MKTYSQLLKNDKKSIERRNSQIIFLKENKTLIFSNFYPDEQDYKVFVGCMEIFNENGVNYFKKYTELRRLCGELNYANGFEAYCKSIDNTYGYYPCDLNEAKLQYINTLVSIIDGMSFFEIASYNNKSIDEYSQILESVDKEAIELKIIRDKESEKNKECRESLLIKEYYEFEEYNDKNIEQQFKEHISFIQSNPGQYKIIDGRVSFNINKGIEDDIKLNEGEKFIVYFYLDNGVVAIGRTESLISYIAAKMKQIKFDSITYVRISEVESEYLYVRSLMYYNLDIPSNVIKVNSKYFTTLNIAKRVYKIIYRINIRDIKNVIKKYDIESYNTKDICVIDKRKLEQAIKDTYGNIII